MKLKYSLLALLILLNINVINAQEKLNYEKIKNLDYVSLKPNEQEFFKSELIKKLSEDTLAIAMGKLQSDLVSRMLSAAQSRTEEQRAKLKAGSKSLPPVERLKLMGVSNPEKYLEDQKLLAMKMLLLSKKYPEINKLDRMAKTQVLKSILIKPR